MSTEMGKREMSKREIAIPEGVEASLDGAMLRIKGTLGKTHKSFKKIPVNLQVDADKVTISATGTRKKDRAILNTAYSIVRNLCEGVQEGYTVKMKVVYAHFPITIKAKDKNIMVENFQGERAARVSKISGETKVVPKGDDVIITGMVLTDVTQTAANLQQATKVKNKDHRVFLDGIYVYEKKKGIEK